MQIGLAVVSVTLVLDLKSVQQAGREKEQGQKKWQNGNYEHEPG